MQPCIRSAISVLLPSFLLYLLLSTVISLYNMCVVPQKYITCRCKDDFFSPEQWAWQPESRSVKRRLQRIKIGSSFGLIKKLKSLSQREKAVLLVPVQHNTAKISKQHNLHTGIMTSHKVQKAVWDAKKKGKKRALHFPTCKPNPSVYMNKWENDAIKQYRPCNPFNTSTSVNRLSHVRYKTDICFYSILLKNDILAGFLGSMGGIVYTT